MDSPSAANELALPLPAVRRRPFYGWVCVVVASVAMVATLPGRTIGLGAIVEPLLKDLTLTHDDLGSINLVATIFGAAFALGVGRLVDRVGARPVCVVVAAALGMTVVCSAHVRGYASLMVLTTLTRGLGQCALSVVSIAVVGKWFVRRVGMAMAVYSLLLSIGFMVALPALEYAVHRFGWRAAWGGMGWIILLGFVPMAGLLLRSTPESVGMRPDGAEATAVPDTSAIDVTSGDDSLTLIQAMRTMAFWSLAACGFLFALFFNGFVLFRESILAAHGFDAATAMSAVVALTFAGLAANGVAGWASQRYGMRKIAGASMLLMALAAVALPALHTPSQAVACAALIGFAGGGVTVVFFASWSHTFGRVHVGRIQGAAQVLTVIGSALGPWVLAKTRDHFGSYDPSFRIAAMTLAVSGVWAWATPYPLSRTRGRGQGEGPIAQRP